MALKRRRTRSEEEEVPTTSFSDIAFLLIIFFILAASLSQLMGFVTDMPSGQKSEAKAEKSNIVNINDGVIILNDDKMDIKTLRKKLGKMELRKKAGEDRIILLEASGPTTYQLYYEVMAAISRAGGIIALVSEEKK